MKIIVKVLHEDSGFELALTLISGASGLERTIRGLRVQKPGLAIAGFTQSIRPDHVQILGNTEMEYLTSLSLTLQKSAIRGLVKAEPACVIITSGETNFLSPPPNVFSSASSSRPSPALPPHSVCSPIHLLCDLCNEQSIPLFSTPLSSGAFIERLHQLLGEYLSPEINIHGVLLDIFGVGVMLTGKSGIGKSECALDLIMRGHRLISDDVVVAKIRNSMVEGHAEELTRHHMEVRGLGIINVQDLFGAAAVRENKRIELVVNLAECGTGTAIDRTGVNPQFETILEHLIPKITLPIRAGRNVASIVEVAARNHLLKIQGHDSAERFQKKIAARLKTVIPDDRTTPILTNNPASPSLTVSNKTGKSLTGVDDAS